MKYIKTNISGAKWEVNVDTNRQAKFTGILSGKAGEGQEDIFWMDELLEGGIKYHECSNGNENNRPLIILLSGPPGSGKSTLALELCYRFAENKTEPVSSLFFSSESEDWKLRDKACDYGWSNASRVFKTISEIAKIKKNGRQNEQVYIFDYNTKISDFEKNIESNNNSINWIKFLKNSGKVAIDLLSFYRKIQIENSIDVSNLPITDISNLLKNISQLKNISNSKKNNNFKNKLFCLVFDSLNIVPKEKRSNLFDSLMDSIKEGPKIAIFVLDTGEGEEEHRYWEHKSDLILHIDYKYSSISNYFIRYIEIKKARYQAHVWGRHQLKIYGSLSDDDNDKVAKHPYRKEGGIFIYPSIHYYLSQYKRESPETVPGTIKTPIIRLNELLDGGLPEGRCIGFIGSRGGHKSHLGYLLSIHPLLKADNSNNQSNSINRTLVISLREDIGFIKTTINQILKDDFKGNSKTYETLIDEKRLKVLYFPPGYVTPEEFFHRVFVSIQELKSVTTEEKKRGYNKT